MKDIGVDEIFLLSEISDKMQLELPKLEYKDTKGKTEEEVSFMMKQVGIKVALEVFKKLHKAKKEVLQLLEKLTGKKASEMSLKELKDNLIELFSKEGVMDFLS